MPTVEIAKCESLLNDFCVTVANRGRRWSAARARAVCDRRTGVGADGLIVLQRTAPRRFAFRLFNADGSAAEWSGNGVRCAAAFLQTTGQLSRARFDTGAGPIDVRMKPGRARDVTVAFGCPLPVVSDSRRRMRVLGRIPSTGGPIRVDAGNPHLVLTVRSFDFDWEAVGVRCQRSARATRGVNVEFVVAKTRRRIDMRIYERGVGATPSSGSGALAAFAACLHRQIVDHAIQAESPGGVQRLSFTQSEQRVTLTATARVVSISRWFEI